MSRPWCARRWTGRALLATGLAFATAAPLAAAVDPFYLSRLHEGIAAYQRGAHGEAVKSLRVACFGMLDEEPQLASCLVRLALAQAAAGDREGFLQTFRRLLEGEEMVGLYRRASLPAELTRPFEARVVEWVPWDTVGSAEAFRALVTGRKESQLTGLGPRERRSRLLELAREEPRQARWPLLLAQLERQENQLRAAHDAAEAALRLQPDLLEARCLRGWARVELQRYSEATEDLAGCTSIDAGYLTAELAARVELGQWGEAQALVSRLTPEQRREAAVATLIRRIERETVQPAPSAAAADGADRPPRPMATPAPDTVGGDAAASHAAGGPVEALDPADEAQLGRAQAAVGRAENAEQMLAAYRTVAELASRHPANRRVQHAAAEIAYRASRWSDAVRHFRQGGEPGEDEPLLLFYLAVSLWESGERQQAAEAMRRCNGKLRSTPFVESYRRKILPADGTG